MGGGLILRANFAFYAGRLVGAFSLRGTLYYVWDTQDGEQFTSKLGDYGGVYSNPAIESLEPSAVYDVAIGDLHTIITLDNRIPHVTSFSIVWYEKTGVYLT
jgi:hypothetical protein